MRYVALLIVSAIVCQAGFDETKAWYDAQRDALKVRYVEKLKKDRRAAILRGKVVEVANIDKEIKSVTVLSESVAGEYVVTYTTGVRRYVINEIGIVSGIGMVIDATYKRTNERTVVITHSNKSVETWTEERDGFRVVFDNGKRRIAGFAKRVNK